MKIVYCIAGTCHAGGMERVLSNKANWLVAHGYEVTIVTTDQQGLPPFFSLDNHIHCVDLNIGYEKNNGKSLLNKLWHWPFKQRKHKKMLTRVLMQEKADIVISMFCNEASFLPSVRDNSKKLLEIHFSRFKRLQYGRKGLWRFIDRYRSRQDGKIAQKYDKFVVLTEEDKTYWDNLDNIIVIPNARTFRYEEMPIHREKTVLAVGRYSYQKGFDSLIEAWNKVCQKQKDWTLQIIGNGEWREMMQTQIKAYGIQQRTVLREIPAEQMKEVYASASIFVLSSRYEGLPMVLLEAQAAGLPIVSFACKCGPKDVVHEGEDGYLVEEGNVDALAERLLLLMQDEDLRMRMGKAAYQHSSRFDTDEIMHRWERVFSEMSRS